MSGRIDHAYAALTGAIYLARFNRSGIQYFEPTLQAFWRSFWAAGIIGPFFLFLLLIKNAPLNGAIQAHHIAIESLAYIIAWVLFPLVMAGGTQQLDCAKNYIPFIIANNWCSVIQNGIYLPIAILGHAGVLSPSTANFLALTAIIWVVAYTFFIVHSVLSVSRFTAFGIVILEFALGVLIDTATNRFV